MIRLTNTLTRRKEEFRPLDPENVRMYVCGPTVYDRAHLGNARPVVVFDVLFRLLRHVYGEDRVTYVRNFTDVDDKINARAAETGRPIRDITSETIRWYHEDMDALGALRPTHEPRATEYIPQMIAMTLDLIAKGHAYEAQGHVLFRVRSYAAYGRLSGRTLDDMIAGARVEPAPFKEDPLDFVLWKPSDAAQPGWDSPWGRGRPGWHIECSAMAQELLGPSFDIHGGGLDLQFPHHENEIAQSACAHPEGRFAQLWLHNEMLQVEGKKMSKSLGNFFTVRDLLDQGVPGEVIRLVLLRTHYSSPIDWTEQKRAQAVEDLRKWSALADDRTSGSVDQEFLEELADDLNTWETFRRLDELFEIGDGPTLTATAALLGFDLNRIASESWARPFEYVAPDGRVLLEGTDFRPSISVIGWGEVSDAVLEESIALVHQWLQMRREKHFDRADQIRNQAAELGIELRATRSASGINGGVANLHREVEAVDIKELL